MNDNTQIIIDGAKESEMNEIINSFDWRIIIAQSDQFVQNEYNPEIFAVKGTAELCLSKKSVVIHPNISEKVINALCQAVSDYYQCSCHICEHNDNLKVYISKADKKLNSVFPAYSLTYIQKYAGKTRENRTGAKIALHDKIIGKWRLRIQLDDNRVWFLSVFVKDNGSFDRYSLDKETASDSHYEFRDEKALRQDIYCHGDENKYLDEVLISYLKKYGVNALVKALTPYITAQYHFD